MNKTLTPDTPWIPYGMERRLHQVLKLLLLYMRFSQVRGERMLQSVASEMLDHLDLADRIPHFFLTLSPRVLESKVIGVLSSPEFSIN